MKTIQNAIHGWMLELFQKIINNDQTNHTILMKLP
jgi:hypothetical protein